MKTILSLVLATVCGLGPIQSANLQRQLQDDYRHTNDGYFDGNLLSNVIVLYQDAPDAGLEGETICDGTTKPTACTIYIVPEYNVGGNEADMTLFHEMCHIATWGEEYDLHGPRWEGCMKRLAAEGAMDKAW